MEQIPNHHNRELYTMNTLLPTLLVLSYVLSPITGTVTVISQLTNESIVQFEDEPARFVPDRVTYYEMQGFAVYADPPNACEPLQPPNSTLFYNISVNWILIARRLDCDFQTKIENAQHAGYSAIIIHNVGSNSTAPMQVTDASRLVIYASFVGEYYGLLLRDNYTYPHPYFIRIEDDFSLNSYLLPFAIVVGLCFTIMLLFMVRLLWQQVTRWLRERRRSRRRKLPNSALKKLPVTKWTKGDPYETCAICLEDFIEQDKVRVLPCSHGFHCVCIDPWLTKGRRVCPICKRKVVLAEESFRDSDSDTEDETAPLLRNASTSTPAPNPATSGSTFVQQNENPFRRAQRRAARLQHRRLRPRPTTQDSDSTSISSSESQETSNSHQSLPVTAEVHGGLTSSISEIPQAPFPSVASIQPSSRFSSCHEIVQAETHNHEEHMQTQENEEEDPESLSNPTSSDIYSEGQRFEGARPGIEISESEEVIVTTAPASSNIPSSNRTNPNNNAIV